MSDPKPTDAAMRAADFLFTRYPRHSRSEYARIIDRETGLPALERCRKALEALMEAHRENRLYGGPQFEEARAALAEAGKGRAG